MAPQPSAGKAPKAKRLAIAASVSLFAAYFSLLLPSAAIAANVTLAWDANTESNLKGYFLYYGTASGIYTGKIDVGNNTQYTIPDLADGITYYFAVTAFNTGDNESAFSREVAHTTRAITHTITASSGANGQIAPFGSVVVEQGTNQTFSMHPDPNYQVLNVEVDGVSVGTATSYTFNNIAANHIIAVSFTDIGPAPIPDRDGDGVSDDLDDFPDDPNETIDTDSDGRGNNADRDDDNDGMPDSWENKYGLNPLVDDAFLDTDADGIINLKEFLGGTEPNIFNEFFKPEQPVLLLPSNEEVVSLTPVLQTGAFSDPDPTDFHTSSRWQIFQTDDQVHVFDKTSDASLTELTVPNLVLDENTSYQWRVRFEDNHGLSSEWSENASFTTDYNIADANGNGLADHQEVAPTIDLNADGIPDNDQSLIKSVNVVGESTQIGISILDAEPILSIVSLETENRVDILNESHFLDQTSDFPYGLISFKLIVNHPGDEVAVTLHLSRAASPDATWYKYDPVDDIWFDYSAYTEFSAGRNRIYLTLKDGGFGDADGIENGIIVDPLVLSVPSSPQTAAADAVDDGGGSGGGGGGCFISTTVNDSKTSSLEVVRHKSGELAFALAFLTLIFLVGQCLKKLFARTLKY